MAATGNEVARLEQLKGVFPQVVSFVGARGATITLGNGRNVTFSCVNGGSNRFYLLVRVMYNSFELLQGVTDGVNRLVSVKTNGSMKTLGTKMLGGLGSEAGNIYCVSNESVNALNVSSNDGIRFNISDGLIVFIGATIYVD